MIDLPDVIVIKGVELYLRTSGKIIIYEKIGVLRHDFGNRKLAHDFIVNTECHTYKKDNTIWRG